MKKIPATYRLVVAGCVRDLPVVEVVKGVLSIAYLDLSTDAKLTKAVGLELASRLPPDVEVLVMPEGKALSLLHAIQLVTDLPAVIAWKKRKPNMREPVLDTLGASITTPGSQAYHIGADDVAVINGRKAGLVDDIVSRGGTRLALEKLLKSAGATSVVTAVVGTEGEKRPDVISLHHFPVFPHS